MGSIYFTSDPHFGHTLVARLRGFDGPSGPEAHDNWLIAKWRKTLRPDDQLWILGDITIKHVSYSLDLVAALPGKKHLICGNHDPVHPMHREAFKQQTMWMQKCFDSIQPFARRKIAKQDFLLCHFPYDSWGDGPERGNVEPRCNQWRLPDHGLPLLHGHTHGPEKAHQNMFHVGVDAWNGELVPLDVVQEWVQSGIWKSGAE